MEVSEDRLLVITVGLFAQMMLCVCMVVLHLVFIPNQIAVEFLEKVLFYISAEFLVVLFLFVLVKGLKG